jgi:hypothetical protein
MNVMTFSGIIREVTNQQPPRSFYRKMATIEHAGLSLLQKSSTVNSDRWNMNKLTILTFQIIVALQSLHITAAYEGPVAFLSVCLFPQN